MDVQSEKLLARILSTTRIAALGTIRDEEPRVSMVAFIAALDYSAKPMMAAPTRRRLHACPSAPRLNSWKMVNLVMPP